jgi:mannonate dehydratase
LKRRHFVAGGAATLSAGLAAAASRYWPSEGIWNPCRGALPQRLAAHPLVTEAWEGVAPQNRWDAHVHLIGSGDSGSGAFVSSRMESLLHPGEYVRRLFFLNAACVDHAPGNVDRAYVERLRNLVDGMRPGAKLLLFAFERSYDENGDPDLEHTPFHVPNAYARDVARADPSYFEWAASVHPYRADAVEQLEKAKRDGARAVKWLPSAMGIDPDSPKCDAFYGKLRDLKMPLISHAGEERAVLGRGAHDFGNPQRLRRALEAGVRVVVAHCASLGKDRDLDRGGAAVESFSLLERMMGEARYERTLFADISAMTQVNRAGAHLATVIERTEWHPRLIDGSDYPLPGVMPIFSVDYLVSLGLVAEKAAPVLKEIRLHNPLLFDFVLKRALRSRGKAFAPGVFETRKFFDA